MWIFCRNTVHLTVVENRLRIYCANQTARLQYWVVLALSGHTQVIDPPPPPLHAKTRGVDHLVIATDLRKVQKWGAPATQDGHPTSKVPNMIRNCGAKRSHNIRSVKNEAHLRCKTVTRRQNATNRGGQSQSAPQAQKMINRIFCLRCEKN